MHFEFLERVKRIISDEILLPDGVEPSIDNVGVRFIVASPTDPQRLTSMNLPELFYQYGTAFENDEFSPGTNFQGETLTLLINIVFEAFRDNLLQKETLDLSAARFHDKMSSVAKALRMGADSTDFGIDDTRLSVQPYSQSSPSDFEFLQFAIEIDWYYLI